MQQTVGISIVSIKALPLIFLDTFRFHSTMFGFSNVQSWLPLHHCNWFGILFVDVQWETLNVSVGLNTTMILYDIVTRYQTIIATRNVHKDFVSHLIAVQLAM